MTTKRALDWTHPPPDVEPSWLPSALHDGRLERIDTDPRARTVSLVVDVGYLRRFAELPETLRFGVELAGVRAMRATASRRHPDDFEDRPGEPRDEHVARLDAWRALGRTVSLDWDELGRTIAAYGMDVQDGTMLIAEDGAALRLVGEMGEDKAWTTSTWVTIVISGGAMRWTRSDGVPWSAEQLGTLSDAYWDAFAERGERLKRSLP